MLTKMKTVFCAGFPYRDRPTGEAVGRLIGEVSPLPEGEWHIWDTRRVPGIQGVIRELPNQLGLGKCLSAQRNASDEFLVIFPANDFLSENQLAQFKQQIMQEIQRLRPGWAGKLTVTVLR